MRSVLVKVSATAVIVRHMPINHACAEHSGGKTYSSDRFQNSHATFKYNALHNSLVGGLFHRFMTHRKM